MTALQIIEGYGKLAAKELGIMQSNPKAAERLAECIRCEDFKDGWCMLCTCYMHAKVEVKKAFCPKGIWQ